MRTIIVGAGINGVTAAIELRNRATSSLGRSGPAPHPLAASTDISKAVRAAYGPDEDYAEMAERSIKIWRKWNTDWKIELYHELGFLFMRRAAMKPGDFEYESFELLEQRGHKVERIDSVQMRKRFPAWNADLYPDGFLDHEAGYAESGRVVAMLVEQAKSVGVQLCENGRFTELDVVGSRMQGIVLADRTKIASDVVVMTTGAWTPYALPFTKSFFRATGHPVFHLKPRQPELFAPERFPVFGADISTTGYYGFPLNRDGVVKIANHGAGREMSPDSPDRMVTAEEENNMRKFVHETFPALDDAPIVYTRICLYCDTNDGDFWIAPNPRPPRINHRRGR